MFNDLTSPAALMATRRSGKPRDMVAPGPEGAALYRILAAATRVPDHGKLAPWRFIIIEADQRAAFAAMLQQAYREEKVGEPGRLEVEAIDQFARQAPTLVVALSIPASASHIPVWEQELSAGAACMALLVAAHAESFVAGWLTGWAAYSPMVRDAFADSHAKIAGFIFLGTPSRDLDERPRPAPEHVIVRWTPPGGSVAAQ